MITQRRICWPDPDATCLNGNCGFCNNHPYRRLAEIEIWTKSAGIVPYRGRKSKEDAWKAYMRGLGSEFAKVDTK